MAGDSQSVKRAVHGAGVAQIRGSRGNHVVEKALGTIMYVLKRPSESECEEKKEVKLEGI
jgi:hypothetical protein